ncbi:MAG TPA: UDP-N-acetylmuramoyl-L-alanine--D-glutamate ligase, partial [Verrucomicrobiae bacterium]|nr:UDP-N-acetylmuramoyl-L-alanine--D-glutamate ligase [Verrucomicrobiae bacterium]
IAGSNPDVAAISPDMLVLSPGVPHTIPPIQAAKELGIPLWSEIELAYHLTECPIIAITGTNGKTTTTALVGKLLEDAGVSAVVAGNIGKALTLEVSTLKGRETIVAEVSSFQLECIHDFKARVAVVTNITPDHLDRHGTLENYIAAKARVLENQTQADWAVLNYDDPVVRAMARGTRGKVLFFSLKEELPDGICLNGSELVVRAGGRETKIIDRRDIFIRGDHNLENAMAATGVAWALGLKPEQVAGTLRKFTGVAHRQEFVADVEGVRFINDSKGTNPDASMKALAAFEEPIVLIAGGKNKGCDFTDFMAAAKPKVTELVLVGSAADELAQAARNQGITNIHRTASFAEAVDTAAALAKPGDVVLLSPACTSWDMFSSFEERGDLFKKLVRRRLQDKA